MVKINIQIDPAKIAEVFLVAYMLLKARDSAAVRRALTVLSERVAGGVPNELDEIEVSDLSEEP